MPTKRESGQASVETALVFTFILAPVTFGLLTLTFGAMTWAGVAHLTRIGAAYAATHCATDGAGSNVVGYMQANIPPMLDPTQLITGPATISVTYLTHDPVNNVTLPATCLPGCTLDCAPDAVAVSVSGYQLNLGKVFGMSPVTMPSFSTTVQIESGGGNPDSVDPTILIP